MVHETRIGKATIVRNLVLAVGFGGMAVAGCGFNAARDRASCGGRGVRIAGKTSTAQRMKPDSYEYYFDRYTASFAGFFPADAPKYVLVICYETKRVEGVPYFHQGGGRPAIAFAEVVRRMGYGKAKQ